MESNVSLVENDSSGTTVQIDTGTSPEQATNSSETTSTIPQNDMQDAAAQNILSAQETSSDTGNTPNGATSETIEEKAADAAREDISILSDTSSEEALPSQASVTSLDAIIGNTGGTPSVSLGKSSEEHLVIDPIFSSPAPVTSLSPDPLFENILSPKPEPSATSSLFGGMA